MPFPVFEGLHFPVFQGGSRIPSLWFGEPPVDPAFGHHLCFLQLIQLLGANLAFCFGLPGSVKKTARLLDCICSCCLILRIGSVSWAVACVLFCFNLALDRCHGRDFRGSCPRVLGACRLCFHSALSLFSRNFARVASTREGCEAVFGELFLEGHLDSSPASERIQALASLRFLFNRCRSEEQLASLEAPPPTEVAPPASAGSTPLPAGLGWHEPWPAKLTAEAVAKLNPRTLRNCLIRTHFLLADSWLWHPGFKPLKRCGGSPGSSG